MLIIFNRKNKFLITHYKKDFINGIITNEKENKRQKNNVYHPIPIPFRLFYIFIYNPDHRILTFKINTFQNFFFYYFSCIMLNSSSFTNVSRSCKANLDAFIVVFNSLISFSHSFLFLKSLARNAITVLVTSNANSSFTFLIIKSALGCS